MPLAIRCVLLAAALAFWPPARVAGQPGLPTPPARPPCATCIVVVVTPAQIALLPPALSGIEILVEVGPALPDVSALMAAIASRGGRPGVLWHGLAPVDTLSTLSTATTVVLDVRDSTLALDTLVFDLRSRLTALRAGAPGPVRLGVEPPAGAAEALGLLGAAGYWDVLVTSSPAGTAGGWKRGQPIVDAGEALADTRTSPAERLLMTAPADDAAARRVFADLADAARLLKDSLVPATDGLRVACAGHAGSRAGDVYLDPVSLDRVAVLESCAAEMPVIVEPALPLERVQLTSGQAIVRIAQPEADRFAAGVRVLAPRRLRVEEIVAQHQAAAARQATSVRTSISDGSLTVTFEAPGFPAPVTVSSLTTIFRDAQRTDLEQRDVRLNGIAFRAHGVPRLPIVEPERVAAPPLEITLGEKYRYRLAGEEIVAGLRTYVVEFDPYSGREPLFRGRAWIAADDFGIVRVAAAQTGLRGPVVASEQVDEFVRTAVGVWMLQRSDIRQTYKGAAYETPIHRLLALTVHEVNPPDFESRRRAAYASEHTILRDTANGFRYLEGEARRAAASAVVSGRPAPPPGPAPRAGAGSRVRTLAFGVIVDPNITVPLPFAGLSYLDFDLLGTGAQLNAFFGGTFGQLAFSVPSLHGSRWQLAGRAFGIASTYNDRAFVAGREQYDRSVRQRPAQASVWLARPLTARVSLEAGYELEYTHFSRGDATALDFDVPADQAAHGLRVALDAQRAGWNATVWWSGSRRTGWQAWGRRDTGYSTEQRDFQRYGATLTRAVIVSPRLVARGEAAIMSGHDLDRFSQYAFGTFENRLHGYPSAMIRYDRGAATRGTLAWSPGRLLRFDGFADMAFVRDRGFAPGVSRFAGVGAGVEAPAPFGTLVAAEWGYGIEGVNADGRRGTHVVRVTGYKVF